MFSFLCNNRSRTRYTVIQINTGSFFYRHLEWEYITSGTETFSPSLNWRLVFFKVLQGIIFFFQASFHVSVLPVWSCRFSSPPWSVCSVPTYLFYLRRCFKLYSCPPISLFVYIPFPSSPYFPRLSLPFVIPLPLLVFFFIPPPPLQCIYSLPGTPSFPNRRSLLL